MTFSTISVVAGLLMFFWCDKWFCTFCYAQWSNASGKGVNIPYKLFCLLFDTSGAKVSCTEVLICQSVSQDNFSYVYSQLIFTTFLCGSFWFLFYNLISSFGLNIYAFCINQLIIFNVNMNLSLILFLDYRTLF